MGSKVLTIITPVYNRSNLIMKLYESLKNQVNNNFVWVVVDDGSTDDIEKVMNRIVNERSVEIQFYRKDNGGKHTALNLAFSKLETELTVIVDSDDWLIPDATDIVERTWTSRSDKDVAGCVFLRGHEDGTCIGHSELKDGTYDMVDAMFSHNISGDKAEVFRSDILQEYRFPVFSNEKFIGEDYIWRQIYLKHRMMYCNKIIYICEYLEGGLTKQGRRLRISCPLGGMENSKVSFDRHFPLRERMKRAWLFVCYGEFAGLGYHEIIEKSGAKELVSCNYFFGVMLYLFWKYKYLRGRKDNE